MVASRGSLVYNVFGIGFRLIFLQAYYMIYSQYSVPKILQALQFNPHDYKYCHCGMIQLNQLVSCEIKPVA